MSISIPGVNLYFFSDQDCGSLNSDSYLLFPDQSCKYSPNSFVTRLYDSWPIPHVFSTLWKVQIPKAPWFHCAGCCYLKLTGTHHEIGHLQVRQLVLLYIGLTQLVVRLTVRQPTKMSTARNSGLILAMKSSRILSPSPATSTGKHLVTCK